MRTVTLTGLVVLLPALAGCNVLPGSPGGEARLQSTTDDERAIESRFSHGVYRRDDDHTATMVLFEGAPEQPRSALVLRLFWVPMAGATPLESAATNATFHYLVFGDARAEQPLAVYTGAGFISPRSRVGKDPLDVQILDTTARFSHGAAGYTDPIGHGRLTGAVTVARDHDATDAAIDRLYRFIAPQ